MTSLDLNTCQVEAFVAEVTAQPGSLVEAASTQEIFTQQVEGYLNRLVTALCADLELLELTDIATFIGLDDTPAAYVAGQGLVVNAGGDALEFTTFVDTFLELTDTPGAYVANQAVRVNAGGTALEFGQSPLLDHGTLLGLADDDHLQYLLVDGTRAMTGALAMGGFRVTGMAAAIAAGDAVEFAQALATFVPVAGGTFTGDVNWTNGDSIGLGSTSSSLLSSDGVNSTWEQVDGVLQFIGDLLFPDSDQIIFGTGSDSILDFNGTNTIWNLVAGLLEIQGDLRFPDNDECFFGTASDASFLYNGTNLICDSALVGSGKFVQRDTLLMQDNVNLEFGNSGDWTFDYDGTNMVINQVIGTGFLQITEDVRCLQMRANSEFNHNGTDGISASWVNAAGDTVTFSGGILTTVAPP